MTPLPNWSLTRYLRWLCLGLVLIVVTGAPLTFAQDAEPVSPVGEAVTAGPWQMTVTDVLTGGDATFAERDPRSGAPHKRRRSPPPECRAES